MGFWDADRTRLGGSVSVRCSSVFVPLFVRCLSVVCPWFIPWLVRGLSVICSVIYSVVCPWFASFPTPLFRVRSPAAIPSKFSHHDSIQHSHTTIPSTFPSQDSIQNCHPKIPFQNRAPRFRARISRHDSAQSCLFIQHSHTAMPSRVAAPQLPWGGHWRANLPVWWRTLAMHVSRPFLLDPLRSFATVFCGTSGLPPGPFHDRFLSMNCQWLVNDLSVICQWFVTDLSPICHRFFTDFSQIFHRIFTDFSPCQWFVIAFVNDLSTIY